MQSEENRKGCEMERAKENRWETQLAPSREHRKECCLATHWVTQLAACWGKKTVCWKVSRSEQTKGSRWGIMWVCCVESVWVQQKDEMMVFQRAPRLDGETENRSALPTDKMREQ